MTKPQTITIENKNLTSNRFSLGVIMIAYPTWSIFLKLILPEAFDILWQRFLCSGLLLLVLLASYFVDFVKKHIAIFSYVLLHLVHTHYYYLTYKSSLETVYIIGALVCSSLLSIVMHRLIPYLVLALLTLLNAIIVVFLANGNYINAVMLILGLITLHAANLVMLQSRVKIENKLADATLQLEQRNEDLKENLIVTVGQKKDLEKVNKELDRFVHTVSHDIRSPLMGILCYADLLQKKIKYTFKTKEKEFLGRILSSVNHINTMIDDLLRSTKIFRIKNPYENVDFNKLVSAIIQRLEFNIKDSRVNLIVQQNLPNITCDSIKISEVFQNLITNAIKFSTINNHVHPKVEINYRDKGDFHEFKIKDNGIGIDPKHHQEIFEIFQQVDKSEYYEGTGVGLNIVKNVIDDHGGQAWVESELGRGALFFFTIPKNLEIISS